MARTSIGGRRRGNGAQAVLIIFSVIGVIAVICCLACGGCTVGLFTLGAISDSNGGFKQEFADAIESQVADLPDVKRELGEITYIRTRMFDSIDAEEEFESEDVWAFDVRGTNGKGQIFVECIDIDDPVCTRRILRVDGQDFDLGPTPQIEFPGDSSDPDLDDVFAPLQTGEGTDAEVDVPVPAEVNDSGSSRTGPSNP